MATSSSIVHIIGSGHSGSTLLDMILGGHSQVSSLGEVHSLYFLLRGSGPGYLCTCGESVGDCPFWLAVETEARRRWPTARHPALENLMVSDPRRALNFHQQQVEFNVLKKDNVKEWAPGPARSLIDDGILVLGSTRLQKLASLLWASVDRSRRIGKDTVSLYSLVRSAHHTPVIVDSTKNPGAFKRVYLQADVVMRFIVLLRDGRAVCRSRMKRERTSMATAARIWKREHRARRAALLSIPNNRVLSIRYEDLTDNPPAVVGNICRFLDIEFEPRMLEFRSDRHNLGGNPMRFRRQQHEIRRDDRWRSELSEDDLRTFEKIAGTLNRKLGYHR